MTEKRATATDTAAVATATTPAAPPANESTPAAPVRRKFLRGAGGAAVGGAALLAFPMISKAQSPIKLRVQLPFAKDFFEGTATQMVTAIESMSGGRIKIEKLPPNAVVKTFDMMEAVHKGVLDGCVGACGYWVGKNPAFSLFGTSPMAAMDAWQHMGWFYEGGGKAFYDELQQNVMKMNITGFLFAPMNTQALGWFKKEIKSAADFNGLKYRTIGLAADMTKGMGASVVIIAPTEIIPSLDRGVIDAAEYNNTTSDRILGFPDVSKICMQKSYHQNEECLELILNKKKFDALPADLKHIIRYSAHATSAMMNFDAMNRMSTDFIEMQTKQGVKFIQTPQDVLKAQLASWDKVMAEKAKDPFFAKVLDSQKKWAQRVVSWWLSTQLSPELAYNHLFGKKA
jgi:TRAP-type mannitol/chloroaromatic compound transport system substrate-binding protein